jgi:hypothetical protein
MQFSPLVLMFKFRNLNRQKEKNGYLKSKLHFSLQTF